MNFLIYDDYWVTQVIEKLKLKKVVFTKVCFLILFRPISGDFLVNEFAGKIIVPKVLTPLWKNRRVVQVSINDRRE